MRANYTNNHVRTLIKIIGSEEKVGRICTVKQPTVHEWLVKGYVPARHVKTLLPYVRGKLTAKQLNSVFDI